MKSIDTHLYHYHKELIEIFLRANNFSEFSVELYTKPETFGDIELIRILHSESDDGLVMMLALKHCGILNMFDHYLMKCGVHYDNLSPTEIVEADDELQPYVTRATI